jgi:pimeloyl-ACP methyl ester carboxylesterase
MVRVPAGDDQPVGSIFINFGGPGGSAIDPIQNGFRLDAETMARYHLVGFDPRGVGASTPLRCTVDLTTGARPDLSPDNPTEMAALDQDAKAVADRCANTDGDLLAHLGTDAVVADLDLLRRSVGDEQLYYVGLSYGTRIGLQYADRFPELVGAMVLDGVVDPSFTLIDLLRQQAGAFEAAFLELDRACDGTLLCPEAGIIATYDRLAERLERDGPQAGVGTTELEIASLLALYSENLWPGYATALADADRGDLSGIERLHDLYVGGVSFAAYLAVSCIDGPIPSGSDGWNDVADELASLAPRFGAALANELRTCAYWPAPPTGRPAPVAATGSNPVLVMTTTGDAATPAENAINVDRILDASGLVIVDDTGHTAYSNSPCAKQTVADYFATGTVPQQPLRC